MPNRNCHDEPHKRFERRSSMTISAVCVLALALVSSGQSLASVPDANGVYHGCVKVGMGHPQTIDMIDTAVTTSCGRGETAVTWSQTGPRGPIGVTGPMGAKGATGPQGPIGLIGPAGR